MKFEPKVPVETREPVVLIEGLDAGVHRFQLEVFNEKGAQSAPAFFTVEVTEADR